MKKRVLMVSCEGLGNGGVQAIMMGIVRNLYTECHFDMLLFTSEKRYYDDEFLKYGGKIFRVPNMKEAIVFFIGQTIMCVIFTPIERLIKYLKTSLLTM